MQYQFQTYVFAIWNAFREGARIWNIRGVIRGMQAELKRKKELLEKISQYVHPNADQHHLTLGLTTLKHNNGWLFKGVRVAFRRGWLLKLRKLEKLNRKNRILVLENFLLLGRDIMNYRDLKALERMGLLLLINEIEPAILERYFLDRKRRVRQGIQALLLAGSGPLLVKSIRAAKERARRWRRFFFNQKIKKVVHPGSVDKAIKLALMSSAFEGSIPGVLTEKDYLRDEKDPLIQYLYTALIYNDPKRKKNFVKDQQMDQFEMLKEMRRRAAE